MVHLQLGYTEAARLPRLSAAIRWVGIGHSYGFARVMREAQAQQISLHAAISLGGFPRFPGSRVTIRALRQALKRDPGETLAAFLHVHGLPGLTCQEIDSIDSRQLVDDLEDLATLKVEATAIPLLALHGSRDRLILPEDLPRLYSSFVQAHSVYHPTANHALGISEVAWCSQAIIEFLEKIVWSRL